MLDLTASLAIFSTIAMAYIIYIDARPLISQWLASRKKGLKVHSEIRWVSGEGHDFEGATYYPNIAYLIVYNDADSGRTFDGVRVRSGLFETRESTDRLTGQNAVSLHSGEHAEFFLGRVISARMFGMMDRSIAMTENDILDAENNVARGHLSFRIADTHSIVLKFAEHPANLLQVAPLKIFPITVTAKDHPAISVKLLVDQEKLGAADVNGGNPFTTQTEA